MYWWVRQALCCRCVALGHVQLFATLWTVALQAPPSMEFFRQEYWGRLSCPTPGDLSDPGIKPRLLCFLQRQVGSFPGPPGKPQVVPRYVKKDSVFALSTPQTTAWNEITPIWQLRLSTSANCWTRVATVSPVLNQKFTWNIKSQGGFLSLAF